MSMPCPHCNDTGWKAVDKNGLRRVVRCDCRREGLVARMLADARIQPRYRNCELDNLLIYPNERLNRAFNKATEFAEAFPVVDKGLCLIGPHGIGKTHLAVGVLKHAIRRTCARGLFYDTTDLLRLIRSTYSPDVRAAEMDVLRPVMEVELLVLDDIGKEKNSEWVEETMNLIVNTRYNQQRPTIFTTNYKNTPDDSHDVDDFATLRLRVGSRIHSRLHEMCDFLEYEGADYRHLPPNGGIDDLERLWKVQPSKHAPLPARSSGKAKTRLRDGPIDVKWSGGRAGS